MIYFFGWSKEFDCLFKTIRKHLSFIRISNQVFPLPLKLDVKQFCVIRQLKILFTHRSDGQSFGQNVAIVKKANDKTDPEKKIYQKYSIHRAVYTSTLKRRMLNTAVVRT
jgi:hypothetical protein